MGSGSQARRALVARLIVAPPLAGACFRLRRAVFALLSLLPAAAAAGPPLVSDDPHTVGRGKVEWIVAIEALEQSRGAGVAVPVLDWTLGVWDRLDLTAVGSPVFARNRRTDASSTSGFLELGLKWQPLRTSRWNASFSPAYELTTAARRPSAVLLPGQLELHVGSLAVGVDAGYAAVVDGPDRWRAATYAAWQARPELRLLGELWSEGRPARDRADLATGLGLEWQTPFGFTALASAGTGLASRGAPAVRWTLYFGFRSSFEIPALRADRRGGQARPRRGIALRGMR